MIITPLRVALIPAVERLLGMGAPYVRLRGSSDYWLYAQLFSSTCPVAMEGDEVVGVVIAFRSQDHPDEIYVQDVMAHPAWRRHGVARSLLDAVRKQAADWGCKRLYLTSEPDNEAAHRAWLSFGFTNITGDQQVGDVSVISDYKGPGKHRAVYGLTIT